MATANISDVLSSLEELARSNPADAALACKAFNDTKGSRLSKLKNALNKLVLQKATNKQTNVVVVI